MPKRNYDDPRFDRGHRRPRTRREFLAQGFLAGSGMALGAAALTLPGQRALALSGDLAAMIAQVNASVGCGVGVQGAGKIPFIAFDFAGGASMLGSEVLAGKQDGQLDFISTAGYARQGLPADQVPSIANPNTGTNDFVDTSLGLAWHADGAFLRGMLTKISPAAAANVNGAVIPARSDNDTGNNPHNPMYGIAAAGASGSLLSLVGSQNTDSGGNSMAPAHMIDLTRRPTKIDRPADVTGLVDVGDLTAILAQADAVNVMESIYRISEQKLQTVDVDDDPITADDVVNDLVRCGYLKSADLAEQYGDPSSIDPASSSGNPLIVGPGGIFSAGEFNAGDRDAREFQKTASVMKMVIDGFAGAGTVEMGGYDYHGGARAEGEVKNFRAGVCMGACVEYAHRAGKPLMLYAFSDGSLTSNGVLDMSADGRGKGEWTSDNSSTAASFMLVYNPSRRPDLNGGSPLDQARHQQLGYLRDDGSVEVAGTPGAGNVNLLAEMVILNYMALHDEVGAFSTLYPTLGNSVPLDGLIAFTPIVSQTIFSPV